MAPARDSACETTTTDKDSSMWQHQDAPHGRFRPRTLLLAAGLLLALNAWGGPARAQDDPVEDLQAALAIRLEDLTTQTETVTRFRRETLQKKINRLRTIGQLRRALALEEWKPLDTAERKQVADRFIKAVQRVI